MPGQTSRHYPCPYRLKPQKWMHLAIPALLQGLIPSRHVRSPRSSDLPSILHIRRSRSGGCAFSLSEVAGLYVCSVATVSRFLALGRTPTLTLSAAESSAAAHSAGRVDTRPSHEPSPVHMSSRKRGHKLSRSDHEKARGTVCIFFVVLAGSSP